MINKKLVIANWKMNPVGNKDAKKIFLDIKKTVKKFRKSKVVICPPTLYLPTLLTYIRNGIYLGSQNTYWEEQGSFTGEVSSLQLSREKIDYCLVGHSERRASGETDEQVNKKIHSLLKVGLIAVLCIGEKERDYDGFYLAHIKEQIKEALSLVKQKDLSKIVIAYEPLWAIGKKAKKAITGRELYEMSIYIRKVLSDLYTQKTAFNVSILYGGSVDEFNAEQIISEGNVQGFLVGRASLNAKSFTKIIEIVNNL